MITLPESRVAERAGSKAFPSRLRRRGGARYKKGAFAVAAAALAAYAGVAGAGISLVDVEPVPQGGMIALVIGNGEYVAPQFTDDPSALNDAMGVATALERLGFEVRHLEDAGYVDMLQGLLEFSQAAQSAEAAVVFYAGLGEDALDGRNYLFPVDAPGAGSKAGGGDLDPDHHVTEGNLGWIPVTWLMRSVAGASDLRLVVLDAYVGVPLEPAQETIVALSSVVGTLPAGGVGTESGHSPYTSGHSPYTEALLRYLEEPELELGMLFRKVREDVMRATDGRQEPVVYGLPGRSVLLGPPDPAGEGLRVDLQGTMTFLDCPGCPEMVVVPAGSFLMGSPESEEGRHDDEGPVHRVTMARPFAVGVHEVTRGEFARFAESATARSRGMERLMMRGACYGYEGGEWEEHPDRHWRNPGFSQTDAHPVVCVSWEDARAYVRWLSDETGEAYRLLSESEWEYVARAGTTGPYHFGSSLSPSQANYGESRGGTAPVGSYPANAFRLHDVHGNVSEWVEDCWNGGYRGAPADGSAWESGDCSRRVLRGGSWDDSPGALRSALRFGSPTGLRYNGVGFRVARTHTP